MNCDFIAPHYRRIEMLGMGRALKRRRLFFLNEVANARRVLILGDGDGRFLREFVRRNRVAQIDTVDISAGMLKLARAAAGDHRIQYHHADARDIALPAEEYDLVVTHFFFDCFSQEDIRRLIGRVSLATCPHARWLVSEFRIPKRRILRLPAQGFIQALYGFFRLTTGLKTTSLVDHHPLLEASGFRSVRSSQGWEESFLQNCGVARLQVLKNLACFAVPLGLLR